MTVTPPCRQGLVAHDWNEGHISRWCGVCWLVQPYAELRAHRPREIQPDGTLAPRTRTKTASRSRREQVIERDGTDCHYCGRPCDPDTINQARPDRLTIDHVIPRVHGGTNDLGNLVVACNECNQAKADKLPEHFVVTPRKGLTTRSEQAELERRAANRHQRTHTRRDGQPKRLFADADEAWEAATFLADRDAQAMEAFRCPDDDCPGWHVRIVPGLRAIERRALRAQERRWYDDALSVELGVRACGQMKAENTTGRGRVVRALFVGAERRAVAARRKVLDPVA